MKARGIKYFERRNRGFGFIRDQGERPGIENRFAVGPGWKTLRRKARTWAFDGQTAGVAFHSTCDGSALQSRLERS